MCCGPLPACSGSVRADLLWLDVYYIVVVDSVIIICLLIILVFGGCVCEGVDRREPGRSHSGRDADRRYASHAASC